MQERTNAQWLAELRGGDPDEALADLYDLLVRSLRTALGGHVGAAEADIEDFAQEALLKITANLDSFRGESRFTTWAKKIAMNVALTELNRRRRRDVSLQDLLDRRTAAGRRLANPHPNPEQVAFQNLALARLRTIIDEELTEKHREAVVAVILEGMPIAEVARCMGTNQNALYKLLHDARKKLRSRMEAAGLSPQEVLRRYGLDGEKPSTLAELSEELDVSSERVRQMQCEAEGALTPEGEYRPKFPVAALKFTEVMECSSIATRPRPSPPPRHSPAGSRPCSRFRRGTPCSGRPSSRLPGGYVRPWRYENC
jgi:RNA polymerase sigma-70 factor (ECF subfamily)